MFAASNCKKVGHFALSGVADYGSMREVEWLQFSNISTLRATKTGWLLMGSFSTKPTTRKGIADVPLKLERPVKPPPNWVNGVTKTATGPK